MFQELARIITTGLTNLGLQPQVAAITAVISDFLIVLVLGIIIYYITKYIIIRVIKRIALKTASNWDDALLEHKVFQRMALLIPGIFIYQSIPVTVDGFPGFIAAALKLTNLYIIIVFLLILSLLFNQSPLYLLTGLGAFSAVLLLIFKDPISASICRVLNSAPGKCWIDSGK